MKKENLFFRILLLIVFVFLFVNVNGQVKKDGKPYAFRYNLVSVPNIILKHQVFSKNNKEEKQLLPLKAGYTIKIDNNNIISKGVWDVTDKNIFVWRISFTVEEAGELTVYFKDLKLRNNDGLYVYSSDYKSVIGAFTSESNRRNLCSGLIAANNVIIEYSTGTIKNKLPFEIKEIGVVVNEINKGFGDAGSCEVPVNCDEGKNWSNQKSGVTRILVKEGAGLFWCTGSLINNTSFDGKPYILTANHCGRNSTVANYDEWVFDFNYESPDCERPSSEPSSITFTGASLVANGNTPRGNVSDFKLVLLNHEIPETLHLYYNGWDITGDVPENGVVIHHPQGDIKFISTYDDAVSSYYLGQESPNGTFWKIKWKETTNGYGVTEGGSSGAPLFNQDGLIVGQLTGGDASCSNLTAPDYFGKFVVSWDQNGSTPETHLKEWLDPDNTGVETLKGFFKGQEILIADFYTDAERIMAGNYVQFVNNSQGNIIKYHWEFEGGQPSSSDQEKPPLVLYNIPGNYTVKLKVSSLYNTDSIVKVDYISVLGTIYPNPFVKGSGDLIHILIGDTPVENPEINIYDITGKTMNHIVFNKEETEITFNPSQLSAGAYIIHIVLNNKIATYKFIITIP
jgi:hypothetical protein